MHWDLSQTSRGNIYLVYIFSKNAFSGGIIGKHILVYVSYYVGWLKTTFGDLQSIQNLTTYLLYCIFTRIASIVDMAMSKGKYDRGTSHNIPLGCIMTQGLDE